MGAGPLRSGSRRPSRNLPGSVNGVAAPLYFVSSGQVNVQVPYATGAGGAVLGVENNGQVASFTFAVSLAAPGIFTDPDRPGALVPYSTGKRGDTFLAFITGEGLVSPILTTGVSPFAATPLGLLPQPLLPVAVTVGSGQPRVVGKRLDGRQYPTTYGSIWLARCTAASTASPAGPKRLRNSRSHTSFGVSGL